MSTSYAATPVRVAILDASTTPGGRVTTSAEVATRALAETGTRVTALRGEPGKELAAAALSGCSALMVVSPVYRATYPGEVKVGLDAVEADVLADKVMAWIVIGATPHHYLGVDQGFRSLAAWFGCLVPPTNVYLDGSAFAKDGQLSPAGVGEIEGLVSSVVFLTSVTAGRRFEPRALALRTRRKRS